MSNSSTLPKTHFQIFKLFFFLEFRSSLSFTFHLMWCQHCALSVVRFQDRNLLVVVEKDQLLRKIKDIYREREEDVTLRLPLFLAT